MYLFLTAYLLLAIPSAAAVLRQKQTPVVAIAWLLAIVLLPIGGSLFYLLAGYRKPVRDVPPTDSRPAAGIERMLWYGCSTRVRYRNRVEQLHDGGEAFAALISALQGARRYIHLSYYIFAHDRIGHPVRRHLGDAGDGGEVCHVAGGRGRVHIAHAAAEREPERELVGGPRGERNLR